MGWDQGWVERGGGERVGSQGREFGSGGGEGLDEDGGWRIGGLDGGRGGGWVGERKGERERESVCVSESECEWKWLDGWNLMRILTAR